MTGRKKPLKSILSDSISLAGSFNATLSLRKLQAPQTAGKEGTCLHWLDQFIVGHYKTIIILRKMSYLIIMNVQFLHF